MSITRRRILQGAAAAAGLLSIPAIVTRAFAEAADVVAAPLRAGENGRVMYVFCRHNDIVVGGTVQVGRDSETISEQDRATFERILGNARAMFAGYPACVTP
jgi:hypothetical protein